MAFDPSPQSRNLQKRLNACVEALLHPGESRHVDEVQGCDPRGVPALVEESRSTRAERARALKKSP